MAGALRTGHFFMSERQDDDVPVKSLKSRDSARALLGDIASQVNYSGYVETGGIATFRPRETQLAEIFAELKAGGAPVGTSHLGSQDDVWSAIREFFTQEQQRGE